MISTAGGIAPWDGEAGVWLRCQFHAHTTESDGWLSPEMLRRYHAQAGYDVLAITDHDRLTEIPAPHRSHGGDDGLLVIGGTELSLKSPASGGPLHVLGIGVESFPKIEDERTSTLAEAAAVIRQAGGLAYVAHPWWSGHRADELGDMGGVTGVEVFNGGCEVEQGRGSSEAQWDLWLTAGHRLTAIAADDLHTPGYESFRAWTMVHAAERSREAVLAALEAGRSYASTGPRITAITVDGDALRVRSTPARSIAVLAQPPYGARVNAGRHEIAYVGSRLTGDDGHGPEGLIDGEWLTGADFPALTGAAGLAGLRYVRVVVMDPHGRSAWSNPIWLEG